VLFTLFPTGKKRRGKFLIGDPLDLSGGSAQGRLASAGSEALGEWNGRWCGSVSALRPSALLNLRRVGFGPFRSERPRWRGRSPHRASARSRSRGQDDQIGDGHAPWRLPALALVPG
jgi:hypothetical protein